MFLIKAFWKSVIINITIAAVWYWSEYRQFGALQWNRKCDNLIWAIYFVIIWYLIYRVQSLKNQVKKKDGCNENDTADN